MKKLPIGIQSFDEIRSGDYIYVDKTQYVLELLENGKYYFLSRPRRFGKSLLVDTMKCLFEGKKELFEGLYIFDKWNWEEKYPVLRIDFGGQKSTNAKELQHYIKVVLREFSTSLGVEIEDDVYYIELQKLIKGIFSKYHRRVVVLVDEYDKPILDNIENKENALEMREVLKGFYQVLKGCDEYLRFVFLTGVSKFSKVSIFSGLNNLNDITVDKKYSSICGYTQEELESNFGEYLEGVNREEVKGWYNGYSWLGEKVYNPYDVLLFFNKGKEYKSYWFETGTPGFLIKELMERRFYLPNIERIEAGEEILSSFEVGDIHPVALLFQTGYLTIKSQERKGIKLNYILSYPNLEVRIALNDSILRKYLDNYNTSGYTNQIYDYMESGNVEGMIKEFKRLLSSIPNDWYRRNRLNEYEGFYSSVFYSVFQSLGLECVGEDITNRGRIDLTVKIGGYVYIFEFKVIEEDEESKIGALEQIEEKRYWEKYEDLGKEIVLIGIEFSKEKRNVERWNYRKVVENRKK